MEETIQRLAAEYQSLLQKERDAERERLGDYETRLDDLEDRFAHAKGPPSKPLTIPAVFGRSYDENFISDYLAYAIDPSRNGIGEAPLERFLSLCGIDPVERPLADVVVHREYYLEGGRIDLLLEWEDTMVLGIENKILSAEGLDQTRYYAQVMARKFAVVPYHLIYLTRTGDRASSDEFQPVSYKQVGEALRQVQISPDTTARHRVLWEDFLEHLEEYIIMSDPSHFEFSEKAELYLEHRTMIEDLVSAFGREWGEAVSFIEQQLKVQLDGGPWTIDWSKGVSTYWKPIFKPAWKSQTLFAHYEFWFNLDTFCRGDFWLMAEVEGQEADHFLALFDQRYPSLKVHYDGKGIKHHPKERKQAIAWKKYATSQNIEEVVRAFIDAFDEFRFLESEIDQVLVELQKP